MSVKRHVGTVSVRRLTEVRETGAAVKRLYCMHHNVFLETNHLLAG